MRLLFDQNLSGRLVCRLSDLYPNSAHLAVLGLAERNDELIWCFARDNGYLIVSKDDDFHHLSFLRGAPPKVIGIRVGNCSTTSVEKLLRSRFAEISAFMHDSQSAYLSLFS